MRAENIVHPIIPSPCCTETKTADCTPELGWAEQRQSLGIWRTRVRGPLSYLSETVSEPVNLSEKDTVLVSLRGNRYLARPARPARPAKPGSWKG